MYINVSKKLFIQGIFFEEFYGKQVKNYTFANFVVLWLL